MLLVSRDPELGNERKKVLEAAGFMVISVTDFHQLQEACEKKKFVLAIIGYAVPAKEKRRIWSQLITSCPEAQILELIDGNIPDLPEAHHHLSASPGVVAIAEKVTEILRSKRIGIA